MCPMDDSHLTLEFEDHFVIKPTNFFHADIDYSVNNLNEKGVAVEQGFAYDSDTNINFLNIEEISGF